MQKPMKSFLRDLYKWLILYLKRWIMVRRLTENREMTDRLFSLQSGILIIAPHPDDEVFGLGGYLLRYRDSFFKEEWTDTMERIYICYLTDGEHSHPDYPSHEVKYHRVELSKYAINRLKIPHENILRLHLPDGCLSELQSTELANPGLSQNAYQKLSDFIRNNNIDTILAPHVQDYWPFDHVAAYRMAKLLSRQHYCHFYAYWVWAWYQQPLRRTLRLSRMHCGLLPIADVRDEKRKLIDLYLCEKTPEGVPWSGILPKPFLRSAMWKYEVIERIL